MVAYSFQRRFCDPIVSGSKIQTIRAHGKRRHARVDDALQLYFGMRTAHCRKIIPDRPCVRVDFVRLDLLNGIVAVRAAKDDDLDDITVMDDAERLGQFAVADGFATWDDLVAFWAEFHPGVEYFEGVMVGWAPAPWRP